MDNLFINPDDPLFEFDDIFLQQDLFIDQEFQDDYIPIFPVGYCIDFLNISINMILQNFCIIEYAQLKFYYTN